MNIEPVIAVLDLWSLGHSASDIAEKLPITAKRVTLIVARARSLRDPRAVLHACKNGRLIGRAGHMKQAPVAEIVPSMAALACRRGHPQTAKNVGSQGHCLPCERLRNAARPWRAR